MNPRRKMVGHWDNQASAEVRILPSASPTSRAIEAVSSGLESGSRPSCGPAPSESIQEKLPLPVQNDWRDQASCHCTQVPRKRKRMNCLVISQTTTLGKRLSSSGFNGLTARAELPERPPRVDSNWDIAPASSLRRALERSSFDAARRIEIADVLAESVSLIVGLRRFHDRCVTRRPLARGLSDSNPFALRSTPAVAREFDRRVRGGRHCRRAHPPHTTSPIEGTCKSCPCSRVSDDPFHTATQVMSFRSRPVSGEFCGE